MAERENNLPQRHGIIPSITNLQMFRNADWPLSYETEPGRIVLGMTIVLCPRGYEEVVMRHL